MDLENAYLSEFLIKELSKLKRKNGDSTEWNSALKVVCFKIPTLLCMFREEQQRIFEEAPSHTSSES